MPPFWPDSESEDENEVEVGELRMPRTSPNAENSQKALQDLLASGNALEIVRDILDYMKKKGLTLAALVSAICWHPDFPELVMDAKVQYARTALTHMTDLKELLFRLYKPPRKHNAGVHTEGACDVLVDFAKDLVVQQMKNEFKNLDPILRSRQGEISEETLCSIKLGKMIGLVAEAAPLTWTIVRKMCWTPRQEKQNKYKCPEPVSELSNRTSCTDTLICRTCS